MEARHPFGIKSGDPSFTLDASGRIVSWNAPAESLSGVPCSAALGRRCYEIFTGTDPRTGTAVCGVGCAHLALKTGEPVAAQNLSVAVGSRVPFPASCSVHILDGIAEARVLVTLRPLAASPRLRVAPAPALAERDGTDTTPRTRLEVRTLGPVQILVNGLAPKRSRSWRPKARLLLLYLVTRRSRAAPRETLMELLWPESAPKAARQNLRVLVHDLRQITRSAGGTASPTPLIAGDTSTLALDPNLDLWVDTDPFLASVVKARNLAAEGLVLEALVCYGEALSLYGGDFIAEELDAEWCIVDRRSLRQQYLDALQAVASLRAQKGDLGLALSASQRLVEEEPALESAWQSLMSLYWESGHTDRAVLAYRQCCRALLRELDMEPSAETQDLYETIIGSRSRPRIYAVAAGAR